MSDGGLARLSPAALQVLPRHAREAIAAHLAGRRYRAPLDLDALRQVRGAFVTLRRRADGGLRGCIGVVEPSRPLAETVAAAGKPVNGLVAGPALRKALKLGVSDASTRGLMDASTRGLMMKLTPILSGSRFRASMPSILTTSLSGKPLKRTSSSRIRSSLERMACRPLLV